MKKEFKRLNLRKCGYYSIVAQRSCLSQAVLIQMRYGLVRLHFQNDVKNVIFSKKECD